METPNKGDSRWGSLFRNDLQGMLLPIVLITIIGSVNIFSATLYQLYLLKIQGF